MKAARWIDRFRSRILFVVALLAVYLIISRFSFGSQPPYSFYLELKHAEEDAARKFLESQKNPKFVLLRQNQAGFDNQAQEILLHHHLALQSSRIYIYQPFDWRARKQQLPLSAFLLGPTQHSVPSSLVEELCPRGSDDVVNIKIDSSQTDIWKTALSALNRKEKCIVVDNPILDSKYLSSSAAQIIWTPFQKYLSRYFQWSSQILDIVERTYPFLNLRSHFSSLDGERYMALHLQRSDFVDRCTTAAKGKTGFTNWAKLPSILSTTLPPYLDTENATSVMDHCYPPLSRIMEAIDYHARRKPYIRAIHIIHDGAASTDIWKLETALKNEERAKRAGWVNGPMKIITHSGLVPYQPDEKDFLAGVDIEMARRAEVFIGNGYSSLTSYIIALRLGGDFVVGGVPEDMSLL